MKWQIDPRGATPLSEQLCGCVRRAVIDGELVEGEQLPTARDLAAVVGVHTNTVLLAYRTLRTEGLVDFRRGRGVRVTARAAAAAPVLDAAHALVRAARRHGYTRPELLEVVDRLCSE